MRLLFGWEFGAGLGHLTRFRPIGDRLIADGVEVVLALQDIDKAAPFLDPANGRPRPGYTLLQAPRWNIPTDPAIRKIPTHSFADVMNLIGFGADGALAQRLQAWHGLIDLARPAVVIGDFAPSLALAARGRVPSVMVGNGYTTPPAARPMPPIRPWQDGLEDFSRDHERALLAETNRVLALRRDPPLDHLVDMFHGDRTFVFTLPLVDPYARFRATPTLPPFNLPRSMPQPAWAERRRRGVFFYMPRSHPRIRESVETLRGMDIAGEGHVPEITAKAAAGSSGPGLRLHPAPQDFARVIPAARLVVHHGGLSTAVACLLAGTPQLILPWNLEHLVTARAVAATGGAEILPADPGLSDEQRRAALRQTVLRLLDAPAMAERARAAAAGLDLGAPDAGVEVVLAAVRDLAGR